MKTFNLARVDTVIAEVDARWGEPCSACSVPVLGHEVVLSLLVGRTGDARCGPCLADGVDREFDEFLRHALAHVQRLAGYRAAWIHSDRRLAAER